jgi:hypothetical protein
MMDPISVLGQAGAAALTVWANWQTGNKNTLGPLAYAISNASFGLLNVYLHLWVLVGFSVVMTAIAIRNFIKWRRE